MRGWTISNSNHIIDKRPGTYALWVNLSQTYVVQVGRLGQFVFQPGEYLYFGSAFGPGGLAARLGRHIRGNDHPHWHIDHLRFVGQVTGYFYTSAPEKLECRWLQALRWLPDAEIPLPGFGASDCKADCQAHLLQFQENPKPIDIVRTFQLLEATSFPHPVTCVPVTETTPDAFHSRGYIL
jgi:Uri superfamily endonuclease